MNINELIYVIKEKFRNYFLNEVYFDLILVCI